VLWVLVGFLELCCGLAELLLCILPVYLGTPYTFLIKFSYLSKKKIQESSMKSHTQCQAKP